MAPYRTNLEYLHDEFRRLDQLLDRALRDFRALRSSRDQVGFGGLFIPDEEIDELMASEPESINDAAPDMESKLATMRAEIHQRVNATEPQSTLLRLPYLKAVFDLSAFESDLLLISLAPHYDLRYQKIYAFLQDDVGRTHPSIDFALRLLCVTETERIQARGHFSPSAPLFSNSLLRPLDAPTNPGAPLLSRLLKLDGRIAEFLLGSDKLDQRIAGNPRCAHWSVPNLSEVDLVLDDGVAAAIVRITFLVDQRRSLACLLYGPEGSGKKAFAKVVCKKANRGLLIVDLSEVGNSETSIAVLLQAAFREARLYAGAIYLDRWETITGADETNKQLFQAVSALIEDFPDVVFLGSRRVAGSPDSRNFVSVELAVPTHKSRRKLWQRLQTPSFAGDFDPVYLAGAFRFTAGQIKKAIARAETQALLRDGDDYSVTMDDLLAACRAQSSLNLVSFARKLTIKRTWHDLVLPKDTQAQLKEFCQQVRQRARVFDEWGFEQKLSLGKGLLALFSGPSGTGKTLSAEVIAGELGLDLYRVDLSCVVSKYIGETEKNLARVLDEAQMSNAILFFDEADALFGKRSEVKDAHDRYANIEINYLLQRVEEYEGVVILASNLSKNIDSAFIRRLRFCIELPFPDETHRERIWRDIFPPQTPLASEIDFDFLAGTFKLTGGNIRNIALAAAFNAADNGGEIGMEHLMLALKREYQKLGKVCEKVEFGKYYDLVR